MRRIWSERVWPAVDGRLPPRPTARMRLACLLFAVGSNCLALPLLLSSPRAGLHARLAAAAGLVALTLALVTAGRRPRPGVAAGVVETIGLAMTGLAHPSTSVVDGIYFTMIFVTSLRGSVRRAVTLNAVLFAAYVVALAGAPDFSVRQVPHSAFAAVSITGLLRVLAASTRRNERSLTHHRALVSAGQRLVGAQSRDAVHEAAVESAHRLLENDPDSSAALLRPTGDGLVVAAALGSHARELTGRRCPIPQRDLTAPVVRLPSNLPGFREVLLAPLVLDGEPVGCLAVASPGPIPADTSEALVALAGETILALEAVARTERFRSLVQRSSDVFTIVDPVGAVRYQSPSFERLTGTAAPDSLGRPVEELLHPDDAGRLLRLLTDRTVAAAPLALRWRHGADGWRETETLVTDLVEDPSVGGWVLNTRDVTERARLERERRALEERLAWRASHDTLTGLANRAAFADRLDELASGPGDADFAVLFVDLDRFKPVNDTLGHAAGDHVLCTVADRMRTSVRGGADGRDPDLVCRLGGDEFAVILTGASTSRACASARRLLDVIAQPINVAGIEVSITTAIGVAVSRPDREHPEQAVRHADLAMYHAKQRGPGRYHLHEPTGTPAPATA